MATNESEQGVFQSSTAPSLTRMLKDPFMYSLPIGKGVSMESIYLHAMQSLRVL